MKHLFDKEKLFRKKGILVEQHILALWGSHLMVVELMGLVEVGDLLMNFLKINILYKYLKK